MTTLTGRVFILLVSACAGLVVNHFYSCPSYKFLQACVYGWLQKQQNERFSNPHLDSNYATHLDGKGSIQSRYCICVTNINKLDL